MFTPDGAQCDWLQVKGNTIFDNIIITDEVAEAEKFFQKWKTLNEVEKAKQKDLWWGEDETRSVCA